jgi:hypothetical protein
LNDEDVLVMPEPVYFGGTVDRSGEVEIDSAVANRTREPSRAGADIAGLSEDPSFFAVGQALGLHHQTVQRCVERAVVEGPLAALDDRPRPGREPTITIEAKTWLVDLLHDRGIRSNPRPIKGADDILEILELARGDAQPLR